MKWKLKKKTCIKQKNVMKEDEIKKRKKIDSIYLFFLECISWGGKRKESKYQKIKKEAKRKAMKYKCNLHLKKKAEIKTATK